MKAENRAMVVSRADEDDATLRNRFQDWGYLYIRNYVAAEKCSALLSCFLNQLDPHVLTAGDSGLPVLGGDPFFETDPIWDDVYPRIQSLEEFHEFFHGEDLLTLMRRVAGAEVFVYPMKMARISTPGKIGYETPPHQDAYSHHAGPTMAGVWVALHDISAELGRVKVLPHSHRYGVRKVFNAEGVGGVQCEIFDDELTWHVSDFEQGDVLIFHSSTVHKAEPNLSESAVRLSVDTRFCDHGAPVFSTNLEPHHGWRIDGLGWERIYRNWRNEAIQWYWRDYPNLF